MLFGWLVGFSLLLGLLVGFSLMCFSLFHCELKCKARPENVTTKSASLVLDANCQIMIDHSWTSLGFLTFSGPL